jgi:hypothetical protein
MNISNSLLKSIQVFRVTCVLLAVAATHAAAQSVVVSIGSGSAAPGASITVPVMTTASGGAQPAAVRWTIGYPSADLSIVNITAGASVTAASKSIACSSTAGSTTCVAYGINSNIIGNGALANVTFMVASGSLHTSAAVSLSGPAAASGPGSSIPGTGVGGTITIVQSVQPTLTSLICSPSSLGPSGVSGCTVTLSSAALAGGFAVALASNNPYLTVLPSVTVTAGTLSAGFSASAGVTVPTPQTAIVTASAPGGSQTFSLNIAASTWTITGAVGTTGSGATIALTGTSTASTTANTSGAYMFSGLANGSYTITPSLSGYTFSPASLTVTVSGANVTAPPFTVSRNNSGPGFITGYAGSDVRNDYSGWVGTQLTVGSSPLAVTSVGRACLAGNFSTHTVKFVNAATGQDVAGGSASVNMAGCAAGQSVYAALLTPITLQAGLNYYLVSSEVQGGDTWYDIGAVTTTSDALVPNSVYSYSGSWISYGSTNTSFVPPNFQYTVASGAPFITAYAGSKVRNDYSGWVGTQLTVGSSSLTVTSVGRACLAGNSSTHTVKFVNVSTGQDVSGGSASVSMAGCTAGHSVYATLLTPISLQAGLSYYLVSSEVQGGDTWYDLGAVSTTSDASVPNSVFSYSGSWISFGSANTSFVPPNFEYTVASGAAYITGYAGSNARNDYGGWVGTQLTVGSSSLTVASVGRACLAGNSSTHTVKFVNAATGQDVAGGSASVNMAGCTAGHSVYAALLTPISLQAGLSYYLVSLEVQGGDKWYDLGAVSTTSDASVTNSVYAYLGTWIRFGSTNTSYVPPNFEYSVASSTAFITGYTGSDVRNDYDGWVGTQLTVGSSSLTVTSVGRACLAGNSGTHTVKFVNAATGQDVSGGSASVNMAGCTAGHSVYVALPAAISLQVGLSYYLVSLEVGGGDKWYDLGAVSTTSDAVVTNSVYTYLGSWIGFGTANTSFVPPNFRYHF